MAMQSRDLDYFRVIAAHGHLGRASASLALSQPALTKSLRRLEVELGAQLFERTPKGMRLTPVGSALLDRASQVRLALDQAQAEVGDLVAGRSGRVRLGIGPTLVELMLSSALATLLAQLPDIRVQVTTGMNDLLMAEVASGALDVVLCTLPARAPAGMVCDPLFDDELTVIGRRQHPLRRRRRLAIEVVAGERWALPSASVFSRRVFDHAFETAHCAQPTIAVETNSVPLLLSLVACTDMLTLQSARALQASRERAGLQRLDVPALHAARTVGLVYRPDAYFPRAAHALLDLLRQKARDLR